MGHARYAASSPARSKPPLARALVAGHARDGAVIKVGLTDGKLTLSYDNPP